MWHGEKTDVTGEKELVSQEVPTVRGIINVIHHNVDSNVLTIMMFLRPIVGINNN